MGLHRTPNKGAHFEHAQKQRLSLCVLIRAQLGRGKVSDNAIGAPQVRTRVVVRMPWRLYVFFGMSLLIQHAVSAVQMS